MNQDTGNQDKGGSFTKGGSGDQKHYEQLQRIIKDIAEKQLGMTAQQLTKLISEAQVDRMLGCVFGAFIGDALGAYCEFTSKFEATTCIDETMRMPGGGTFDILPGQVTDDSEMALHMLEGLQEYNPEAALYEQTEHLLVSIAKQYVHWLQSKPFDIGITCSSSLSQIQKNLSKQDKTEFQNLQIALEQVKKKNQQSLSNGFLMRITPMACFYTLVTKHRPQDKPSIQKLLQGENKMTHSNKICLEASRVYIGIISRLILRGSHAQIQQIQSTYEKEYGKYGGQNLVSSSISLGFNAHKNNEQVIDATKSSGFFRIAYAYTFHALRQVSQKAKNEEDLSPQLYKSIMANVIKQGGDTDTNACIVGGLVGSILGFRRLPIEYVVKQMRLKLGHQKKRNKLDKFYEPSRGFVNLIKLIRKFQILRF